MTIINLNISYYLLDFWTDDLYNLMLTSNFFNKIVKNNKVWLTRVDLIIKMKENSKNIWTRDRSVVETSVLSNNLIILKYFNNKFDIEMHKHVHSFLKISCTRGYLEISKWLWNNNQSVDVHIENELIFKINCQYNQIETSK